MIVQLTDDLTKANTAANQVTEGSESRLLADLTEQYKRNYYQKRTSAMANQTEQGNAILSKKRNSRI